MSFKLSEKSVPTALSEMNVTPLVDVMLVLLIIFMISTPMMHQGITVHLPQANAPALEESANQLIVTVDRNQRIFIAKQTIAKEQLLKHFQEIFKKQPQTEVIIQADQSVAYGRVAKIIADVKQAGIQKVGLLTETERSH
jgi:TolR protein